jgi:hypothetical protein
LRAPVELSLRRSLQHGGGGLRPTPPTGFRSRLRSPVPDWRSLELGLSGSRDRDCGPSAGTHCGPPTGSTQRGCSSYRPGTRGPSPKKPPHTTPRHSRACRTSPNRYTDDCRHALQSRWPPLKVGGGSELLELSHGHLVAGQPKLPLHRQRSPFSLDSPGRNPDHRQVVLDPPPVLTRRW